MGAINPFKQKKVKHTCLSWFYSGSNSCKICNFGSLTRLNLDNKLSYNTSWIR